MLDAARQRVQQAPGDRTAPNTPIIFVDVDDTLVCSFGSKRIPMSSVVQRVRDLHAANAVLYCWSVGGAAYAHRSAVELGIADCFVDFLAKPDILIDDQAAADWRLTALHPNEASSITAQDILATARPPTAG
jgi:hypothetical protein